MVVSAGQRRRVEGVIWDATPLDGPVSIALAASAGPSSTPIRAAPAASACVASRILAEVRRTGNAGSMCIRLSGTPSGTKSSQVKVSLRIGDTLYALMVGDTHAAWRSHQTPETEDDFDLLFAQLAEQPDVRVALDEVREGGDA